MKTESAYSKTEMRTIERLSMCKDVADLIYRTLHRVLTQELVAEYKYLSRQDFCYFGCWGVTAKGRLFYEGKLFYDEEASNPGSFFNSNNIKSGFYHVSISRRIVYKLRG